MSQPPGNPAHLACLALLAGVLAVGGCASARYVKLRSAPKSRLQNLLGLGSTKGPQASPRTEQLLRRYDLHKGLKGDLADVLAKFQAVLDEDPSAEKAYSFAELSFLAGKRVEGKDPDAALDRYGAAVAYAYVYLFDDRYAPTRNPYDPEFRGACDLYNESLESALRILQSRGLLRPGRQCSVASSGHNWNLHVVVKGGEWQPDDFDEFVFVSDYDIQGLTNHYQNYGLGVPLIAIRKKREVPRGSAADAAPQGNERYYPREVSFPITAFLRVLPDEAIAQPGHTCDHLALLELCDPLAGSEVDINERLVPLESDLSTPLAFVLNDPDFNKSPTDGLLHPDKQEQMAGLYMLQPYQPGKIPVLMVHGLWSSPLTWMEMFNDLRSDPVLRERFQFWFYMYPTGVPFWFSATRMRQDLAELRQTLDPQHAEPALDRMVLVGHSMGGLVSKMQTVESGNDFWKIVSDQPFERLEAPAEQTGQLRRLFFFEPNPSVRRVITIGTPHRGSKFANGPVRYLGRKLISLPQMAIESQQQIYRDNKDLFHDDYFLKVRTSLDSLAPDCPALPVLLKAQPAPWVKYHTIIGVLPNEGLFGSYVAGADGVVSYESAHLDDAESELTVNADHSSVHRHPLSVLEVRRILLDHLAEAQGDAGETLPTPAATLSVPSPAALPTGVRPAASPSLAPELSLPAPIPSDSPIPAPVGGPGIERSPAELPAP